MGAVNGGRLRAEIERPLPSRREEQPVPHVFRPLAVEVVLPARDLPRHTCAALRSISTRRWPSYAVASTGWNGSARSSRGNTWGCVGVWFSGSWGHGYDNYVAQVKAIYNAKPWRHWKG